MALSFKAGDLVSVEKKNFHLSDRETGIVLRTGCSYEEEGGVFEDGIMVKMQISNTRGIFPPSLVSSFISSPAASKRRALSRRARVTPSPTIGVGMSTDEQAKESSTKQEEASGKRARKADPEGEDVSLKKSKFFDSSSASADQDTDDASSSAMELRVQRAPSAKTKCQECKTGIRKNALRLQPTSLKRGWLHAHCILIRFGSSSMPSPDQIGGYDDLSSAEQQELLAGLSGMPVDGTKKIIASKSESSSNEEDTPLATLRKPVAAGAKRKKQSSPTRRENINANGNDNNMIVASDSDCDDDKDMPFRVEYATSGRATCKGCDERIQNKTLRIVNRPLFRGKPGFSVYRHLHCTVFEEEIVELKDVGGWRKLDQKDRELLEDRIEESKSLIQKENEELKPDELVHTTFQGEIRGPPPGLSANLLPFQVEGVSWMRHQEVEVPEIRGGIMADEMGMGKTIQTIVTILDNRPKLQHANPGVKHPPSAPDLDARKREEGLWAESSKSWKNEMEMCNVPKKLLLSSKKKGTVPMGARAGTLVICPLIALYQWREEIKKFTDEDALSVGIYHGPKRASENPRELLCKYDIVLTTYQVVEADYRKMVSPNKVKCPNCGGSYKIDKLRVHLKYFCGESARRTEAQSRQRRAADRPQGSRNDSRGSGKGGGTKKKFTKNKTKTMSKSATKVKKQSPTKTVRLKRTTGYDSDSDLSVPDDLDVSAARPRRSAATTATKRVAASAKEWGTAGKDSSDSADDSEGFASASSEDESENSSLAPKLANKRKVVMLSDSESNSSDSNDSEAILRARKKQEMALKQAKQAKAKGKRAEKDGEKKTGKKTAKRRRNKGGNKGKKKKKKIEDSSDESSDESSDGEIERDPLEGIDLAGLLQEAMAGSRVSVLHTMCWWRVVLDEAHFIKSRSSQTAAASFALTSIHRWCLSGTPLQNRVGELYSLIRFLRIDPMAHYFCRKEGCDCKSIHYRMLHGKCQDCGHSSIQHFSHFNKHVLNPIQRAGYQGDGRRAMMKLKADVLDKSLIRRTKETRAEDMKLPPRLVNIRTIRLHPIEEDFYNGLYSETKNSFNDYIQEGTLLNNYAHIFDLLTKMRQAVDHPYLIVFSKKYAERNLRRQSSPAVANGSVDCEICSEPPTDRVVSSCCGSAFCRSCVIDYMSPELESAQHDSTQCPSCREPFTIDLNQATADVVDDGTLTISGSAGTTGHAMEMMPSLKEMTHVSSGSILRRINLAEFATSTKIEALVQELVQMRQQRPGSKALVFSQFVNMLDLIRWRLHSDPCLADLGLGVRIIHGGMNVQSRDTALKDFREDNTVRVLLMSLKAGGVALNLTVANEAYLMDPWWNPAAEMQAIDRTHRLGQYRPIRAVRFIAEGTVEERVLQLQEKKRLVFDGTVGRDAASLKMLTVEDMKALFT